MREDPAMMKHLGLVLVAVLLLPLVLPTSGIAAVVPAPSGVVSAGPDIAVAYADFDGDSRPDVAGVQVARTGVHESEYWIQLRLSSVGSGAIVLLAPSGGLQIAARDVNGDHFPDLVVTTSWLQQPVAVYLNDGRGRFSRVDPGRFPSAFIKSEVQWASPAKDSSGASCLSQESRT